MASTLLVMFQVNPEIDFVDHGKWKVLKNEERKDCVVCGLCFKIEHKNHLQPSVVYIQQCLLNIRKLDQNQRPSANSSMSLWSHIFNSNRHHCPSEAVRIHHRGSYSNSLQSPDLVYFTHSLAFPASSTRLYNLILFSHSFRSKWFHLLHMVYCTSELPSNPHHCHSHLPPVLFSPLQ